MGLELRAEKDTAAAAIIATFRLGASLPRRRLRGKRHLLLGLSLGKRYWHQEEYAYLRLMVTILKAGTS